MPGMGRPAKKTAEVDTAIATVVEAPEQIVRRAPPRRRSNINGEQPGSSGSSSPSRPQRRLPTNIEKLLQDVQNTPPPVVQQKPRNASPPPQPNIDDEDSAPPLPTSTPPPPPASDDSEDSPPPEPKKKKVDSKSSTKKDKETKHHHQRGNKIHLRHRRRCVFAWKRHHIVVARLPAKSPRLQSNHPEIRPVHQHRPGDTEPIRTRRMLCDRRRS